MYDDHLDRIIVTDCPEVSQNGETSDKKVCKINIF